MDIKKTVWISIATGVFLLVVIGAAILISGADAKKEANSNIAQDNSMFFAPPSSKPAEQNPPSQDNNGQLVTNEEFDPGVYLDPKPSDIPSGETTINTENVTVITGDASIYTGETTIDLNPITSRPASNVIAENSFAQAQMDKVLPPSPAPSAESYKVESPKVESKPVATTSKPAATKSTSTSTTKTTATSKPAASKPAATSKPATTSTPAITQYWVQVASYSSKQHADNSRELLDEQKIPCEIFTYKDTKGTLYYRLRVGPYSTKSEATYWKGRIETIKEFKDAGCYITNIQIQ